VAFIFIILFYFWSKKRNRALIEEFAQSHLLTNLVEAQDMNRKKLKNYLFIWAILFLVISLGAPQWGVEFLPISNLSGNLIIAVDTSLSMSARDIKPSRMENSKLMLKSLVDNLSNFRIGIVAFSGTAHVQCPLTTDLDAVKYFISAVRTQMLPIPGTNISEAIMTSVTMLARHPGEKNLILLTDGEDHSKNLDEAIGYLNEHKIRTWTIGIGKPEGEVIPILDSSGKLIDYKKDGTGKTVVTKLDENILVKIASKTQGEYIRYGDPESVSHELARGIKGEKTSKTKGYSKVIYKNRYQIPLVIALSLLLIEFIITEKKINFSEIRKRLKGIRLKAEG
jgi:Ca-activated chloride channel family protein